MNGQLAQSVSLAGLAVWLRADGTMWLPPDETDAQARLVDPIDAAGATEVAWPDGGTVLVADVHLGKAHQFSARGVPLPAAVRSGTDQGTLARLIDALHATRAARLVVLGDLFHGPQGGDSVAQFAHAMSAWAAGRAPDLPAEVVLIGGNHDTRAGADLRALKASLDGRLICLPEHGHWQQGGLACTHHPEPVSGAAYTLCGHWHPCVPLSAPGRDRLRLPCFWLGDPVRRPLGILPAFGSFTGMHPIRAERGDRVWAITPGGVHAWPV